MKLPGRGTVDDANAETVVVVADASDGDESSVSSVTGSVDAGTSQDAASADVTPADDSGGDNNADVSVLAGLLDTDSDAGITDSGSSEQSVVRLWETDTGVAIVPPAAPAGESGAEDVDAAAEASTQTEVAEAVDDPGESESKWAPPAEVAALYYPKEPLEESSADLAPVPQGESGGGGSVVDDEGAVSVTSGRLDTRQVDDQPSFSCAETVTGATMAMPVIREDGDLSDDPADDGPSVGAPLSPEQLAALEEGFRAKAAGNFDGARAAWEPLAMEGLPTAQYLVGLLYLTGDALPRNLRAAYAWFSLAGGRGHQLANCERLRLAERLSPDDIALANDLAGELAPIP